PVTPPARCESPPRPWTLPRSARHAWQRPVSPGEPHQIDYRVRHHSGSYRGAVDRAQCVSDQSGQITRWLGTCTDILDLKDAEQNSRLLLREMDRRVKHLFDVTLGMSSMTARSAQSVAEMTEALKGRLTALAKAHDFVRTAVGGDTDCGEGQGLRSLISTILESHLVSYSDTRVHCDCRGSFSDVDDHRHHNGVCLDRRNDKGSLAGLVIRL
ncbi:HWE histidine kinase domain-containing protein, partial [Paracoccus jeotgali]|uniref:HWE histidine kinase domain-containing protein n=1 Tax=Paracoccus jeotgali TaxID=2065379 RepID=UPI0028AC1D70